MNILFATTLLNFGGVETNLLLLSKELTSRGHAVTIASSGGTLVPRCAAVGARHVTIPMGFGQLTHAPAAIAAFRAEVVRGGYDVLHVFAGSAATVAKAASMVPPRAPWPPVISSVMGLQNSPDEPALLTHLRNLACTLGAAKVLIMSPAIGEMMRRLPIRRTRMVDKLAVGIDVHLRDKVDQEGQARLRAELGLAPGRALVTTIGQLAPRKSHELFVRAAAKVLREQPQAVFAIAGEGPARGALESEIRELGAEASVRLLGERADIANLLSLTDVYVKPGIVEGFIGITVLEAQTMDCPVVTFETEDVKMAVQHGVTGLIARQGDPESLATEILRLLRDQELASRLARAGRAKVEAEFSVEAVVTGLLEVYRSVS